MDKVDQGMRGHYLLTTNRRPVDGVKSGDASTCTFKCYHLHSPLRIDVSSYTWKLHFVVLTVTSAPNSKGLEFSQYF